MGDIALNPAYRIIFYFLQGMISFFYQVPTICETAPLRHGPHGDLGNGAPLLTFLASTVFLHGKAITCPSPMAIGLEHSIFEIC